MVRFESNYTPQKDIDGILLCIVVSIDEATSSNCLDNCAIPSISVSLATTGRWNNSTIAEVFEFNRDNTEASNDLLFIKERSRFEHVVQKDSQCAGSTCMDLPKQRGLSRIPKETLHIDRMQHAH